MITKKYLLKLFFLSLLSMALGAAVVFALNYRTVKDYLARKGSSPVGSPRSASQQKQEPQIATFSGIIKPVAPSTYAQGSHVLEDSSGKVITVLKSPKIDLNFLEGQTVEVEGIIKKMVGGEETILTVDKVRF
jgi:hypothetical protein